MSVLSEYYSLQNGLFSQNIIHYKMDKVIEKTVNIPLAETGNPTTFVLPKPFRHPSLFCISGTTNAGKTTWIYRFLKNLNNMFENEIPKTVLYCYGIYQKLYSKMEREMDFLTFHEGIPSKETILNLSEPSMIVLDDLCHKVCENIDMELLFSQTAHHMNISVCLMKNNLFYQGKNARTITLNTNILVLMKNPSDVSQIQTLARRIFPQQKKEFTEAYRQAVEMNNGKGYLIVDLSAIPTTSIILKTNIFPGEDMILFKLS